MGTQDEDLLVKPAASVDRGANWLGSLQKQDGEFHGCGSDLAGYYKALLMFAICGRMGAGGRCLSYVKEKFSSHSGELSSGTQKTSLTRMQRNLAHYMDGWVAIGKTPEFVDRTLDNGKSGWAAGLLAQATGEERYREAFRFIMPNVLGRQGSDGEFGASSRSHKTPGAGKPASSTPLARRL